MRTEIAPAIRPECAPANVIGQDAEDRVRRVFLVLCFALGFLQAWTSRMELGSDTIEYLDMGDQFWRGHWGIAINGIWTPLYGVILDLGVRLFHPSLYWVFPLVHAIAFLMFMVAMRTFDFFTRELIQLRRECESNGELAVPAWIWLLLGYTFFSWGTLRLITVSETNADMLVAAFFFVVCGLLVKIRRNRASWPAYLALGLVLGASYLTKPIMFPISLACLIATFGCSIKSRKLLLACGTLLVFVAVTLPFIAALSKAKHKLTYSESGAYNYATYVDHIDAVHWQGDIPGAGKPAHPTRQIFDRPATFEFGSPLDVTYPVWYDQSYWSLGLKPHFDLRSQLKVFLTLSEAELAIFFNLQGSMVAGLFILFFVGGRKWAVLKDVARYWFLLLPAIGALALYSLVHLEPRYLGPFAIVTILCLFLSVHLPRSEGNRRVFSAVAVLIFVMFLYPLAAPSMHLKSIARDLMGKTQVDPNSSQALAMDLQSLGLRPGDRVASLESSDYTATAWAYLAHLRIVAEVHYYPNGIFDLSANNFWVADSATQEEVLKSMAKTGAVAAISQFAPPASVASGWTRLGDSQYYLHWLRADVQSSR
jgi:hypothetical protein